MNIQESKYKACVQLSAIGDALGWITEFVKSSNTIEKMYKTTIIDKFYNWEKQTGGRFNGYVDIIKGGSYSDDTQLALAVARSIQPDGKLDNDYFSKIELPNWLYYSRGGGRTVKTSASKIQRKSARWFSNFYSIRSTEAVLDYREAGANGAAMRIYPIVLANLSNREQIKKDIFSNSIITHGHPRAILGAMFFGLSLDKMFTFRAESFNPLQFIEIVGNSIHTEFNIDFLTEFPFSSWINEWNRDHGFNFLDSYSNTIEELLILMRLVYKGLNERIADKEMLEKLGCLNPQTKGSGIGTVAAGIYFACRYHDNPQKSIINAVNHLGSDTDSIAAFAGALLGALNGVSAIPAHWREIQDYEYLEGISDYLLKVSNGEIPSLQHGRPDNSRKSLNEINKDNFSEGELISFNPIGTGVITSLRRENTLTRGKYNLIINVSFDIGQSCVFAKLFNISYDQI